MSMIRRERRQWDAEPFIPPFPGVSMTGGASPTISSALQSSAVWACVKLVASTISMLPLEEYTLRDGVRTPVPNGPFLDEPAAGVSMVDWAYMVVMSAELKGNTYGRVVKRDNLGYPLQVELVNPETVTARRDQSGMKTYTVNGTRIPTPDIWHYKINRLPGFDVGLSTIQSAAVAINRDKAIQQFSLGYFQDAPHPTSVLTSDQAINQEQARTIKERLMNAVQGREPLILGAGLTFKPLSVSPEESQFLQTQKLGVAEIARMFLVPPEMIAAEAGNSMTYANIESKGIDFLTYSILHRLRALESALSVFFPRQKHVRFNVDALLRTDMKDRLTATAIGIASHQLTPDEARAMGDLPPLTTAQKKLLDLVPMTVSPSGRPLALPGSAPAGDPTPAPTSDSDPKEPAA